MDGDALCSRSELQMSRWRELHLFPHPVSVVRPASRFLFPSASSQHTQGLVGEKQNHNKQVDVFVNDP